MNSHVDPELFGLSGLDSDHLLTREAEAVEIEVLATALDLVLKFAQSLINDPIDIEVRDERELPAPKETMVQCFALILMSETRSDWRRAIYDSGLKLAYFWPDIGLRRLKLPDNVFDQAFAIDRDHAALRESLLPDEGQIRTFSAAFSKVREDHERIAAIFDKSVHSLLSVTDQLPD